MVQKFSFRRRVSPGSPGVAGGTVTASAVNTVLVRSPSCGPGRDPDVQIGLIFSFPYGQIKESFSVPGDSRVTNRLSVGRGPCAPRPDLRGAN